MTTFCSFSRQAFLPHFHKENVDKVIDKFKNREGGEISTFIDSETLEHNKSPLTQTSAGSSYRYGVEAHNVRAVIGGVISEESITDDERYR